MGHRCGLNPVWLWPWLLASAVVLIGTLSWELAYAAGATIEKKKSAVLSGAVSSAFLNSQGLSDRCPATILLSNLCSLLSLTLVLKTFF